MDKYDQVVRLWQSYNIESIDALDKYLDNFRILFAFHSSKIENREINYHDTREIFENGKVLNYTGSPRTLFELQNQKLCYEFLKDKIINKEMISISLMKEIHKILTAGTYDERRYLDNDERPGEFKKHDYVTGIYEIGSAAEHVENEIAELLDEINTYDGSDVLKAAAYLHIRFEYIHPFADGNGRVGRTLTNYYLMINGYPPFIVFDEDKCFYYECLQKYDAKEEIEPLYEFFKYQMEKTWKKTLEKRKDSKEVRKSLKNIK